MQALLPFLPGIQIGLSILLIVVVLLQNRGTGVGSAFGGSGTIYRTKRGVEKMLFRATIIIGILFTVTSLARLVV